MIQKPKGTYDVINGNKIIVIENILQELMDKYNYEYFRTPIFEASELFHRSVGETSDIVTKETYDFKDRAERNLTLRPEGTAGIIRSFIENKLYGNHSVPVKAWYYGPMFRYERPQSGRFREFYQFGVEVLGSNDAITDAEVISIPVNFYKILGLKNVKVNLNTLGDNESRNNYRNALLEYFKPYLDELCEDCKERYNKNPLRILDCKVDANNEIMKNAPKITSYLNEESKTYFENVKKYLQALDIEYEVNPNIVRGLDYYTHTVFEVTAEIKDFGSQNVLCAGGRYDNLVKNLNGPETPGVGFALGMERLFNALEAEKINLVEEEGIDVYISYMSENEKAKALRLCMDLRLNGFKVEIDYMNRSLKSNFKQADHLNSKFIIIIGEEEINNNFVTIKNNKTKEEQKVELEYLIYYLDEMLSNNHECTCDDDCDCGCDCNCNHE
ncbi:histidine--tRNA ligase [Acholeplasma sp. CAG:878]|jgi:histidyl-tRNA synthetase|nr:histidine--tRNA ligase [Acholeplasma sp. CAG:878]